MVRLNIGPADAAPQECRKTLNDETLAVLEVGKVQDSFLEGLGCITYTMLMHLSR
jgi:hypothetical protein